MQQYVRMHVLGGGNGRCGGDGLTISTATATTTAMETTLTGTDDPNDDQKERMKK